MFERTSRYHDVDEARLTTEEGRVIAYKRRRFVPATSMMPTLTEVTVTDGDRLDVIAARTLGDPEQFWRICDANDAINPFALVERPGRRLRIPIPQV